MKIEVKEEFMETSSGKKYPFTIVIDSREQKPFFFDECEINVKALKTGDYSIKGYEDEISLERKTLVDFVHSIIQDRDRFEREILRAKKTLKYFAIIVETDFKSLWTAKLFSKVNRATIENTILRWSVKYGIPIIPVGTRAKGKHAVLQLFDEWVKCHTLPYYMDIFNQAYNTEVTT